MKRRVGYEDESEEEEKEDEEESKGLKPSTRKAIQALIAGILAIVAGELIAPAQPYWVLLTTFIIMIIFKSSFIEKTTSFSLTDSIIGLVLAFLIGLFIYVVYKKTFNGVIYSHSFNISLLIMTLNRLGSLAAEKGMKLVYHHHMGTGVQTTDEIRRLMEGTDPDNVSLLCGRSGS